MICYRLNCSQDGAYLPSEMWIVQWLILLDLFTTFYTYAQIIRSLHPAQHKVTTIKALNMYHVVYYCKLAPTAIATLMRQNWQINLTLQCDQQDPTSTSHSQRSGVRIVCHLFDESNLTHYKSQHYVCNKLQVLVISH